MDNEENLMFLRIFYFRNKNKDNNENLNFRQRIFLFQNHITENYFPPFKVHALFQLNDLGIHSCLIILGGDVDKDC